MRPEPLVGLVESASALVLPLQPIPPPPAQVPGVPEDATTPEAPPPALTCVVTDATTDQPVAATDPVTLQLHPDAEDPGGTVGG